jgi:hypothetical protein
MRGKGGRYECNGKTASNRGGGNRLRGLYEGNGNGARADLEFR